MKEETENTEEPRLCEKCGSVMVEEEGKWICPKCDGEIDFFGEDDGEEDE